jgi:surface antigen
MSCYPRLKLARFALGAALLIGSSQAAALVSLSFLTEGFFANLSAEDAEDFRSTVARALQESPDANVVTWRAADGERVGKIYPKFTYETRDTTCRRTLFALQRKGGTKQRYRLDLCLAEGTWTIAEPPPPLKEAEQAQLRNWLNAVLNDADVGEPVTWHGTTSGTIATAVVLNDSLPADSECRESAVSVSDTEGRTISGRYRFCREPSGEWSYSPASE